MARSVEETAEQWFDELRKKPHAGRGPIAIEKPELPEAAAGLALSGVLLLSPEEIRPHPLNERFFRAETDDYFAKLRSDIEERGILVPLICRADGVILAGHNRWKTAREIGLRRIPVQKVLDELSLEKEKEFLIKDNLLRRHLSSEEKKKLILELYGEELERDRRGGDRKSEEVKIKNSDESLIGNSANLAKKIEKETGIKAGTAQRIIAGIRKEKKPKLRKHKGSTDKEKKRLEKLRIHIRTLDQTLASLRAKIKKAEQERSRVAKEMRKLAPEFTG